MTSGLEALSAGAGPRAIVLSDLHLLQRESPRNDAFLRLIESPVASSAQALWLLGDIYDLFIGPYKFWGRTHARMLKALERLAERGTSVLWIEGNHDFHIAKLLASVGVEGVDADVTRDFGGRKVFLSHGDRVNSNDEAYLRWRAFTRGGLFRATMRAVPDALAERFLVPLGEKLSHDSRGRDRYDPSLRALYADYARKKFTEGYDAVFLGHCHLEENLNEGGKLYFNLGSWVQGPYRYGLYDAATNRVEVITF